MNDDGLEAFSDALDDIFSRNELSKGEQNLYRLALVEKEVQTEAPRYSIFNVLEKPYICDICGRNAWQYSGAEHEEDDAEFICDHSQEFPYYMIGMFVGRVIKEKQVEYVEPA